MLVYGDHQFTGKLHTLRARLLALAAQAAAHSTDLDRVRGLLIACGQVEQGVADAQEASPALAARFHQATAQAAAAFYSLAWQQPVTLPSPRIDTPTALGQLQQILAHLADAPDLDLAVNVPEGFSFYALYPEQYLLAAGSWLADHPAGAAPRGVVVGVRSIGTTLAAVVATVLRAAGREVQSLTVRPTGHPYARQVELAGVQCAPGAWGLIVDEGPGLSGSSMAATAAALVRAGIDRTRLAFLPGHGRDPGSAGDDDVRAWWQSTPRYVGDARQLTFHGRSLPDGLAAALAESLVQMEDFSGGLWRHAVYADTGAWPPVCTAFERIKLCATLTGGARVLFKFLGLAASTPDLVSTADRAAALLEERAAHGIGPQVLGTAQGYVATAWVAGEPLAAAAITPARIGAAGAYVAQVAGAPLSEHDDWAARARLAEMLAVNTREALGEEAAARIPRLTAQAAACHRRYGDGRMQPHEWLVDGQGRLVKVDPVGHDHDHTLIGSQSVLWDLAGLIVEWGLDDAAAACLLRAYQGAGGTAVDAATLDFYRAAYLAFRLGQCTLAAQVHDPTERERLWAAAGDYAARLAAQLGLPHAVQLW